MKRNFETIEQGTEYTIPNYEVIDGQGIQLTGTTQTIKFVRGSKLKEEEVEKREGTLHEHLLSMIIEDLKYKNNLVPSRESALVITKLEEARMWMEERQRSREASGTSGTYQK
jgi:hypothetical protein